VKKRDAGQANDHAGHEAMRRRIAGLFAVLVALFAAHAASAQSYPSRTRQPAISGGPVALLINFAPG
jgi:hypothetical protein